MAEAPAKTILFGEHAVVYGEPGIAIPLPSLKTTARFYPDHSGRLHIHSFHIGLTSCYHDLSKKHPIRLLVDILMSELNLHSIPSGILRIDSEIPVASGLGSGAASTIAMIRAFSEAFNKSLDDQKISDIAFEIEKVYHGNPSGLDNTVITYAKPIFFVKGKPFEILTIPVKIPLLVVSSGIKSSTIEVVNDVRSHYDQLAPVIHEIGEVTRQAKTALLAGDLPGIGNLMNQNQELLKQLTVSSPELDRIYSISMRNGAIGAKLSGSGRGGNLIVLAQDEIKLAVLKKALLQAGLEVLN